jgi:hypothetical protein
VECILTVLYSGVHADGGCIVEQTLKGAVQQSALCNTMQLLQPGSHK